MDILFPPVRSRCCVALLLVAFCCFMSDNSLAILAIFVLQVGLDFALSTVATFFAAVVASIVPSPCGEGGEEFGDLGGPRCALRRERGDECVVAACGGGGNDEFGWWRGGGRRGG